ncbi:hypothetical protein Y1Q_0000193 [Alligator mississippiensis]|uniref:Uncharacterized protein n=1 Tax=Alligator mississippiensis TaxID=8496 RepID=A0A151LYA1_ALLMI|nr:hypothetical protein Y1Q_0000193 [Alligator mississippiensis]
MGENKWAALKTHHGERSYSVINGCWKERRKQLSFQGLKMFHSPGVSGEAEELDVASDKLFLLDILLSPPLEHNSLCNGDLRLYRIGQGG